MSDKKVIKRYTYGRYGEVEVELHDDGTATVINTVTGAKRTMDVKTAFGQASMMADRYRAIEDEFFR